MGDVPRCKLSMHSKGRNLIPCLRQLRARCLPLEVKLLRQQMIGKSDFGNRRSSSFAHTIRSLNSKVMSDMQEVLLVTQHNSQDLLHQINASRKGHDTDAQRPGSNTAVYVQPPDNDIGMQPQDLSGCNQARSTGNGVNNSGDARRGETDLPGRDLLKAFADVPQFAGGDNNNAMREVPHSMQGFRMNNAS